MKTKILISSLIMIFIKTRLLATTLFSKKGAVFLIPFAVTANVIDVKLALLILFVIMAIDFTTGIGASHFVRQRLLKSLKGEELKKLQETNLISSQKLKLSGVKFTLYMSTILVAYGIEFVFFIKSFKVSFTEADLTLSIIVILFWCFVELYSIIFENFKKMGFDVTARVSNIFKKYKSLKSQIK
jgi:hypothetical protein